MRAPQGVQEKMDARNAGLSWTVACPILAIREGLPTYDELGLHSRIYISVPHTLAHALGWHPHRSLATSPTYRSQNCAARGYFRYSLIVETDGVRLGAHDTSADEY
jgi:hypothetical protein